MKTPCWTRWRRAASAARASMPFSSEPPKDPRWFTLDNVVLGSHCAASTAGASRNMGRMATANLIHDLGL